MAEDRALIIAIEDYPGAEGLAASLPGTNRAAADFYAWLRTNKLVPPANVLICSNGEAPADLPAGNKRGTTRDEIKEAVIDLVETGRDKTGQLYVFLSGHGFGLEESARRKLVDTFVASDFRNLHVSGDKCIRLGELSEELWMSLGGVDHYFFVDCCRNRIPEASARAGTLALALDRAELGRATRYTLYSTVSGETSLVRSGFGDALVRGLQGDGRAKQLNHGKFWVVFERLFAYMKARLKNTQDVDRAVDGEGDGHILQLADPEPTDCTIAIEGCEPDAIFRFTVIKGGEERPAQSFQGNTKIFSFRPSDDGYQFKLTAGSRALVQIEPAASEILDLYEPCTVKFELAVANRAPADAGGSTFRLESIGGDLPVVDARLQPPPREPTKAPPPPGSRVCDSIAAHFPTMPLAGGGWQIDFSDTLGAVTEQDPNLWLAWLGASRILQPADTYSRLGPLPLEDFTNEPPQSSPLYVLAGLDLSDNIQIGIGKVPQWRPARPVPEMRHVYELKAPLSPGVQSLISISRPDRIVSTIATFGLPNRATFVVVQEDAQGRLNLQQFLLPIHALVGNLNPVEYDHIREVERTLDLVRLLCVAEKRFSQRHSLGVDIGQQDWALLLNGKWLDPLMALMAAFEIIRQGKLGEHRLLMNIVLGNMTRFFSALPDVTSLAMVMGAETLPAQGVPLLREALMSARGYQAQLPLSSDYLDYDSMWTSWRGAVAKP